MFKKLFPKDVKCFPPSPTAHGSPRRSGPLRVGVRLPLGPVQDGPSEDGLQLFGLGWGDGVAADRQLHQGQAHAPHVGLNRVVSALQSLRLLRSTRPTSGGAGRAKMPGRGEGWAQEAVERIMEVGWGGGGGRGGCYGKESWGVVGARGQRMGGFGRKRRVSKDRWCVYVCWEL